MQGEEAVLAVERTQHALLRRNLEHAEDAVWLIGLLEVLDDEPLIVVDRATGAACEVTISGIGDNFQLHTLLAATLIPGFVAG